MRLRALLLRPAISDAVQDRCGRGAALPGRPGSAVYLRSTIRDVLDCGRPWVFSNGNCGAHLTEYFDDLSRLDAEVDWPLQAATMWNSTADDPTRATRRAAEFLVHRWMPWTHVRDLTVRTRAMANLVEGMLTQAGQSRPITVRPEWYYQGSKYR